MENRRKEKVILIFRAVLISGLIVSISGCQDPLSSLLSDEIDSKVNSLEQEAHHVVQTALTDVDAVARVNAIEVVATTGRVELMPLVQRLLQDQIVPVRYAAALAVGDLQYVPAQRMLTPLLKDPDSNVIIAASYAMGRLGATQYLEVIRKAIESPDQEVRANSAFLLGKIGDRGALRVLKRAQEDKDSSEKVRFQAMEARAKLGDEDILQRLWAIILSAYADDRVLGLRAIGALGTRQARDIIATKLEDPVLEVRLVAAEQLGMLGDPTGEPQVLEVFQKNLTAGMDKIDAQRVHILASLAIGHIGTPALTKYLPLLLKNESKYVRIAAAKAVFQTLKR
ncbi:MAG: HEAT repeat domain-containing protein [Sedimentisphaerales bacterium]|nr:HEAT repeat domain-containing protein [Sedimentisphaerales bacterium]